MPLLPRPGGVELHWEERGEGPLAVLALGVLSHPPAFEPLMEELSADHRVVRFDARGTGSSTRTGPYDIETDTADLIALVERLGGDAVVVCNANATHVAVRAGAERPDLVRAVVASAGAPAGRAALEGSEGLAASSSVVEAVLEQLRNDYRGALRALIPTLNVQIHDEQEIRERVDAQSAYTPQEATLGRVLAWIDSDQTEQGRALGDRLWMLQQPDNPWFPADTLQRMAGLFPEAHSEDVADGPVSRPDLTADAVRRARVAAPQT